MTTWTLLENLTLKSTAILTIACLAAFLLRRRSAAARHIVWTAAFAALLALPLLSVSLPSWPHPFANAFLASDSGVTFHARSTAAATEIDGPTKSLAPAAVIEAGLPTAADPRRTVVLIWAGGAMLFLFHLLWAYANIWRLRRGSVASAWQPREFGIDEPVSVLEIPDGMPMAAGVFRPAIFLPAESADWTRERLQVVVAHEYAHIRRGDAAAQLLARAALCLHWFNPLAWIAWRALLKERERAADDLVLASGAQASDYAGHLLEIARTLQGAPAGAAAGIAMARRSQLEGRLLAILDSGVQRGNPGAGALAVTLVAALLVVAPLATVRAQSQSEQLPPPDVQSTIATANAQKNHEILEQSAVAYEKLRKFAEAQQLREAALAIRKLAGNAEYAVGLVRLGELAQKRNSGVEAMRLYTQAVELGDMPETAPALFYLGLDAAFRGKDVALGMEYLQRARNVARTGNEIGRAMTWLGMLAESDPSKAGDAESILRAALALEDPGSGEQALTTEFLARLMRKQERTAEAEALEQSAVGMRKARAARLSPMASQSVIANALRVGNGVSAPSLLYKVEPSYSEEARVTKQQGTVLLKVVIDVDGTARDVQVVKSLGMGLDEKAVEALSAWRFKPGEAGGVPVPVQAQIEINFRLM